LSALAQHPPYVNLRSEDTGLQREPAQTHGEQRQTTKWLGKARPESVDCDVHADESRDSLCTWALT